MKTNTTIDKDYIVEQLSEVIEESDKMTNDVMDHLDVVLLKLDEILESKDSLSIIDGIKNNIFITMESMQAQDANRQKIERVINHIEPDNGKYAASAKHISGDNNSDVVDDDELAALIASMGGGN